MFGYLWISLICLICTDNLNNTNFPGFRSSSCLAHGIPGATQAHAGGVFSVSVHQAPGGNKFQGDLFPFPTKNTCLQPLFLVVCSLLANGNKAGSDQTDFPATVPWHPKSKFLFGGCNCLAKNCQTTWGGKYLWYLHNSSGFQASCFPLNSVFSSRILFPTKKHLSPSASEPQRNHKAAMLQCKDYKLGLYLEEIPSLQLNYKVRDQTSSFSTCRYQATEHLAVEQSRTWWIPGP